MARLLMAALRSGGHEVFLASRLRSRDGEGDPARQARLARLGDRHVDRFVKCCQSGKVVPPDLWFTYHLYYKAPDLIGPEIAARLGIPYVIAEASNAPKRARGVWADSHQKVLRALGQAALTIGFNSRDKDCVLPCLGPDGRYLDIKPFLDGLPYPEDTDAGAALRARLGVAADVPLLLAVGMMRPGVKIESYRILADALLRIPAKRRWALVIAGDGDGRPEVEACFAPHRGRVHLLGGSGVPSGFMLSIGRRISSPGLRSMKPMGWHCWKLRPAACRSWRAMSEGCRILCAMAFTGLLSTEGDSAGFAANLDRLLLDMDLARMLGAAGRGAG